MKTQRAVVAAPVAANAAPPATPERWLLVTDDLVEPMTTARDGLEFVSELIGVMTASDDDHPSLSANAWLVVSQSVWTAKQEIEAALERVKRTINTDVVVPAPEYRGPRVYQMWEQREAAEASAKKGGAR